jgi:glycosyltransferase involved in cell wall biosynthesis
MNVIIIPAYEPDERLKTLVEELLPLPFRRIVVIDDGSSPECLPLFDTLEEHGCVVLHHAVNQGKGAAIKTGIAYAREHLEDFGGYVTCDADGQHRAEDIQKVSEAMADAPCALVMGARDLTAKNVPAKSRFGNGFSSFYFRLSTGIVCKDTQTGLRGIPVSMTDLALGIPENRYDYEMNFLMKVAKEGNGIVNIPIATVYLDRNSSSHFKPLLDSFRIYKEPLKFALSSLLCAAVDLGIFTILAHVLEGHVFESVFIATVTARVVSGILNFLLNRIWSFQNYSSIVRQFRRYFLLYLLQLGLSIAFVSLLAFLPISLTVIKIFVDGTLFLGSFFIQKRWVFAKKAEVN